MRETSEVAGRRGHGRGQTYDLALERAERRAALEAGAVKRGDDPRAVEARRVNRERTELDKRLREAERALLARADKEPVEAALVIRLREWRHDLWGPRRATAVRIARAWLSAFEQPRKGRKSQQAVQRGRWKAYQQALDGLRNRRLSAVAAEAQVLATLADPPRPGTIRKLIGKADGLTYP